MLPSPLPPLLLLLALQSTPTTLPTPPAPPLFTDATQSLGLPLLNSARLTLIDLNNDTRPDIVARTRTANQPDTFRVFLNTPPTLPARFTELQNPNLPTPALGDLLVFHDLNNDGFPDTIFTRNLDLKNPAFSDASTRPASTTPPQTSLLLARGDGTFSLPIPLPAATRGTTLAVSIADANLDGLPDIALANSYDDYGKSLTAYPSDLLLQTSPPTDPPTFTRLPLPDDALPFTEQADAGPRPLYGILFTRLLPTSSCPELLQLAYGRRANRFYVWSGQAYTDLAPQLGIDGDTIRHGRYPNWLKEVAKRDSRFDRPDELPFRSHGNTFDATQADLDRNGLPDLILTEITHAWAGESSDRSRVLLQTSPGQFATNPAYSLDRPATSHTPTTRPSTNPSSPNPITVNPNWNQGDLFTLTADLNLDGYEDLVLASSDYPDPPPRLNQLRIFLSLPSGGLRDATSELLLHHLGAQQISLADIDSDGDLDLLVGQSFNRLPPTFLSTHLSPPAPPISPQPTTSPSTQPLPTPIARLYLNTSADRTPSRPNPPRGLSLKLTGDPSRQIPLTPTFTTATLKITYPDGTTTTQSRTLLPPGGHNGKLHPDLLHFAIPATTTPTSSATLTLTWPSPPSTPNSPPLTTTHPLDLSTFPPIVHLKP